MKFKKILLVLFITVSLIFFGCANDTPEETPGEDQNQEENQEDDTKEDAETTASIVNEESAFLEAISEDGTWIIATLQDLEFDEELVVEGEFRDKDDENNDIYRKLALYAQDQDRNVTERYTVTAPKMTIKSPNTNIQGGTFEGDIFVEADGFTITDATIEGNVYFANEEYESTFELVDGGEVTGETEVGEDTGDTDDIEDSDGIEDTDDIEDTGDED
jgi:hypothetical protein